MADEAIQRYVDARVNGAKTVADAYFHVSKSPSAFVAGVQYALDKILGQAERVYNIPYPEVGLGDVVTVHILYVIGHETLEKAKRGEPQ